jgi:hypothetical protein
MTNQPFTLRALGLCGADDSVHPNMLIILAHSYPFVEFGILFRPDKEGQPRYASSEWVQRLVQQKAILSQHYKNRDPDTGSCHMKLAAHLCSTRVNDVLRGDDSFVKDLITWGFTRVQINATEVNGVDTSILQESVPALVNIAKKYPSLEFIIQQNDETKPLWQGIFDFDCIPSNISMLMDESKGTGILCADKWDSPSPSAGRSDISVGYAGGIGPDNIRTILEKLQVTASGHEIWIDMESRLRSNRNGQDIFDLDKCYQVIDAVCESGLHSHPQFLSHK